MPSQPAHRRRSTRGRQPTSSNAGRGQRVGHCVTRAPCTRTTRAAPCTTNDSHHEQEAQREKLQAWCFSDGRQHAHASGKRLSPARASRAPAAPHTPRATCPDVPTQNQLKYQQIHQRMAVKALRAHTTPPCAPPARRCGHTCAARHDFDLRSGLQGLRKN